MKNSTKNSLSNAQEAFNDFNTFFNSLVVEDTITLSLGLDSHHTNGAPFLTVKINGTIVYANSLPEGYNFLKFTHTINNAKSLNLEMSMSGKSPKDTIVENGQIVKDKFISIKEFYINGYDIVSDYDLFYSKFNYASDAGPEDVKVGFWRNATLSLTCDLPFSVWYNTHSTKNVHLADNLKYNDNKILAEQQYQELMSKLHLLK